MVDFNESTVTQQDTNFEFPTCMGTMVYHEGSGYLYHIGGMGSQGNGYRMRLAESKWEKLDKNHSSAMNTTGLELMDNSGIYFD